MADISPNPEGAELLKDLECEGTALEDSEGFLLGAFECCAGLAPHEHAAFAAAAKKAVAGRKLTASRLTPLADALLQEAVADPAAAAALERLAQRLAAGEGRPAAGVALFSAADRCFSACSDPGACASDVSVLPGLLPAAGDIIARLDERPGVPDERGSSGAQSRPEEGLAMAASSAGFEALEDAGSAGSSAQPPGDSHAARDGGAAPGGGSGPSPAPSLPPPASGLSTGLAAGLASGLFGRRRAASTPEPFAPPETPPQTPAGVPPQAPPRTPPQAGGRARRMSGGLPGDPKRAARASSVPAAPLLRRGSRPLHSALLQPRGEPSEPAGVVHSAAAAQASVLLPAAVPRLFGVMAAMASAPDAPCTGALLVMHRFVRHAIAGSGPPPWGEGLALLRVCRALALRPDPPAEPLAALLQLVAARHPDLDIRDGAQLYASLLAALPLPRLAHALAAPAKPRSPDPASGDSASMHPAAAPAQAAAAGATPRAGAREGRGWVDTRVGAALGMRLSLEHAPSTLRPPPAPPSASGERELLERLAGPVRLNPKPGVRLAAGTAADDTPRPQATVVSSAANPTGDLAAGAPVQTSDTSPVKSNGEALAADAGSAAAAGGPAPDPGGSPAVSGHASADAVLPQYLAHVNTLDLPEITLWLQLGLHAERPPEQLTDTGSGERQAGAAGATGDPAAPGAGAAGAALFGVEVAFVSEAALRRALADPEVLSECGLDGISGGSTISGLPPCDAVVTGSGSDAARVAAHEQAPQGPASAGRREGLDGQGNKPAGSESSGEVFWDRAQRPRGAWTSMGTVRVPRLSAQADPKLNPEQTMSWGRTIVPLRLAPAAALPDVLLPTARFTDAAGAHGCAKLAPLPLRLAHLLTPAPLPQSLAGRSAEVFDALWADLSDREADAAAPGSAQPVLNPAAPIGSAPDPPADPGWLSLRALDLPPAAAEAAFRAALGPFCAGEGAAPPAEPPALAAGLVPPGPAVRFLRALCFLPPAQHLLLRLELPARAPSADPELGFVPGEQREGKNPGVGSAPKERREGADPGVRAAPGERREGAAGGPVLVRVATDFGACLAWVDDFLDLVFGGSADAQRAT